MNKMQWVVVVLWIVFSLGLLWYIDTDVRKHSNKDLQDLYEEDIRVGDIFRKDGHKCQMYYDVENRRVVNIEHDVMSCPKCRGMYE